jgi:F-type H+-transporting ATPase subunit b
MDELIKTFHIDWSLMLAQAVNFLIVLLVLYKFAYKPILKTLNDRTKKIEKGLKDSADASQKLEEITEKEKEVLINAKKEAQEIIKKYENEAKKNAESITTEMKEKNAKMLEDAKTMIEEEKKKMLTEIKSEVAELVVLATEKVIAEKMNSEKDKEIIEKSLNH